MTDARLAVRLPNWVGDVCMALPALQRLCGGGSTVHAYGRAWAAELLSGLPLVVHELPRGLLAGAAVLRGSGATRGLLFPNSLGSALQMRLAGLLPLGYRGDGRRFLLDRALPRTPGRHEVEAFWRLAVAMTGGDDQAPVPALRLPLTDRHRSIAAAALSGHAVNDDFTVLCPFATGLANGRDKTWPPFAALTHTLIDRGETVIVCPGPGESVQCADRTPGAIVVDGLALGAYAAVLARARRVVANDSGPLHLAAAVGVPVLGIFGVSDPARTRPWSPCGATVGDGRSWPDLPQVLAALDGLPRRESES